MAAIPDALSVLASVSIGQWEVNLALWSRSQAPTPRIVMLQSAWKPRVKMGHKELARRWWPTPLLPALRRPRQADLSL